MATAAGIPGGCRLSTLESCHNQGHDKKDTVFCERVNEVREMTRPGTTIQISINAELCYAVKRVPRS